MAYVSLCRVSRAQCSVCPSLPEPEEAEVISGVHQTCPDGLRLRATRPGLGAYEHGPSFWNQKGDDSPRKGFSQPVRAVVLCQHEFRTPRWKTVFEHALPPRVTPLLQSEVMGSRAETSW